MDPDVILLAIQFNHRDGATHDAFNIRFNETVAVTPPEWRRKTTFTAQQSPAAYAIKETCGNTLIIKAQFYGTANSTVLVRAVQARPDARQTRGCNPIGLLLPTSSALQRINVLGEVREREIRFDANGETDLEDFELQNVLIWTVGVSVSTTEWRWQFRATGTDRWTDFAITRHRIYTVLQIPNCPWQQNPSEEEITQLPWAEALEYACDWAAGALDVDEVAMLVTRNVYDLGLSHFRYDGSLSFYSCPNFNCTQFLDVLKGGLGVARLLNCSDCATVVSSFANLLGCDLRQVQLGPCSFTTNPIKLISHKQEAPEPFGGHEVAWKGSVTDDGRVFDACLQLDGDPAPDQPPFSPLLPTNIPFGSASARDYRFRFSPATFPRANTLTCRKIGISLPNDCGYDDCKSHLKQRLDFDSWRYSERVKALSDSGELLLDHRTLTEPILSQWSLVQPVQRPNLVRTLNALYSLWTHATDSEILLRVDVYELESWQEAQDFALRKLGESLHLEIGLLKTPTIGDVSFADADYTSVLFIKAEFVVLVRSAGRERVSILATAVEAERNLLSLAYL